MRLYHRLVFIQHQLPTPPNLPIGTQHPQHIVIWRAAGQHIPHKLQVVVLLTPIAKKELPRQRLQVGFYPSRSTLFCNLLTQPLGQVGVPPRPRQHPPQHLRPLCFGQPQPLGQGQRLVKRKVGKINAIANVKRGTFLVADQLTGGSHPH